ncbi:hypothetical protein [Nocardioides sp.]|uniref:hypothetical protein n=1 Tax=Nocardioides sp. TaxID=35761 RepID=UPI002637E4F1|nr:hypothetical protein [Nocardioides sp.]
MPHPRTTETDTAPLRVLVIHRRTGSTVRYIDQVVGEDESGVDYRFGRALLAQTDLDVVFLPRFGSLFGAQGPTGPRLVLETLRVGRDLQRRGIALVRTLTEADRQGGRWPRLAARVLDRFTSAFVVFDDSVKPPTGKPVTVIPYADHRDRFLGYPRAAQVPGRVLWVGASRLGPGLQELVAVSPPPSGVRFVGAADAPTRALLDGCDARTERLSDGALVQEISAAELVVVPSVEEPEDLSAVYLSLAVDRPVLVPDTAAMRALQSQVGATWLPLLPAALDSAALAEIVADVALPLPGARPSLPGASLNDTAKRYATVFRAAASTAR